GGIRSAPRPSEAPGRQNLERAPNASSLGQGFRSALTSQAWPHTRKKPKILKTQRCKDAKPQDPLNLKACTPSRILTRGAYKGGSQRGPHNETQRPDDEAKNVKLQRR